MTSPGTARGSARLPVQIDTVVQMIAAAKPVSPVLPMAWRCWIGSPTLTSMELKWA